VRREDVSETKSAFDELDAETEAKAIAEAEAEIDAGKGVMHAKVRRWLLKLAKGETVPPPCE
jgi:predicted transcriptional regulator